MGSEGEGLIASDYSLWKKWIFCHAIYKIQIKNNTFPLNLSKSMANAVQAYMKQASHQNLNQSHNTNMHSNDIYILSYTKSEDVTNILHQDECWLTCTLSHIGQMKQFTSL